MTDDEMLASVKLYSISVKKEEDYDQLAKELNFDIDEAAQKVVGVNDDPA